jgi:hypothetical protein
MQREIEKRPVGGLDMTTNYQDVNPVDYVDAKNLTNNERDINSAVDLKGIKGIEKILDYIPEIGLQTKKYRVFIDSTNDPNGIFTYFTEIIVSNSQGISIAPIPVSGGGSAYNFSLQVGYELTTALAGYFIIPTVTTFTATPNSSTYLGYFDIEFDIFDDYTIKFQPYIPATFQARTYDVQVIQEFIPSTYTIRKYRSELIGSCRTENDTFLFWTPCDKIENTEIFSSSITISVVYNTTAASMVDVTFSSPHGLFSGEIINLINSTNTGLLRYEGEWVITVVDDFTISLNWSIFYSVWTPFANPIKVELIKRGFGGISVVYRSSDQNNQYSQLKHLIRSKGLNFSKYHQIDARAKGNNLQKILKFTDNNNPPKMLIYEGDYNTDGFIYGLNGYDFPIQGLYFYESIFSTSRMLIGENDFKLSVVENKTGGELRALNMVYYARGVFSDFTKTSFSRPTNPISVIYSDWDAGTAYSGSLLNMITTKSNTVTISNIPPRTFAYIELVVIDYYNSGSFVGGVVKREPLGIGDTSISITHTGEEIYESIDEATIAQLYLSINKALNIEELDNRGVLSNVELQIDYDLTSIAQNIEYGIRRHSIPRLIDLARTLGDSGGEFFDPHIGHKYTGYTLFETVRWGLRVKWKNSNWSKAYWIGDFRVDDSPIGGRRYATLPNYNFGDTTNTYTFGFEFRNLDLDALVDGQKLRDLIDDYEFVRAPVSKEIIASGIVMLGAGGGGIPSNNVFVLNQAVDPNAAAIVAQIPIRNKIYFFSPDYTYDDAPRLDWFPGDEILCLGSPRYYNTGSGAAPYGNYTQTGVGEGFEQICDQGTTSATLQVLPVINVTPLYGDTYTANQFYRYDSSAVITPLYPIGECYGINLGSGFVQNIVGTYPDTFLYNVFYRRPKTKPYSENPENSIYYSVGFFDADVKNDTTSTIHVVFGGDSFVQKTYLYARNIIGATVTNSLIRHGIYSINKTNCQQQFGMYPGFHPIGPLPPLPTLFTNGKLNSDQEYSSCFTPRNFTSQYVAYDKNSYENVRQEATIYWSEISFVDSKFNPDRYFLFANQRVLDLSYGPIKDMKSINDILITLQPKKTERQYFDNTGKLISDSTDILLGTGAVMGRKGDFLSAYGCSNKWGSFVGKSTGGKEVLYYIDSINKAIVRVGADGTVVLSDRNNMSNYLYDHVKLAEFFDRPVYDYGISGIWDQKNRWAIFSVKAHLPTYEPTPEEWTTSTLYNVGDVVTDQYAYFYFSKLPCLFICKVAHTSNILSEPARMNTLSKSYWDLIPVTDTKYYNYFTLVFSETENKFKWFMSPVCDHYASYYDSYITTIPTNFDIIQLNSNFINPLYYYDESGERCEWYKNNYELAFSYTVNGNLVSNIFLYQLLPVYELSKDIQIYFIGPDDDEEYEVIDFYSDGINCYWVLDREYPFPTGIYFGLHIYVSLREDAYFTMSVNETKGQLVKYGAIRYDAELPVYRTDFTTSQPLQSYLTQADFETIDTYEYSPIKNDTTVGNSPDDDTSFLYGKYCLIKTTLRAKTEQIIHKFVTRVRALNRIIPR